MKKMLSGFFLMTSVLLISTNVYAVPVIDGAITSGTEWSNAGYPYYLELFDVNEAAILDSYDISHAVLLQELTSFSGDGDFTNDGVYLLIETYASASLADQDGAAPLGAAIALSSDFNGDGTFDFFATHHAPTDPIGGSPGAQVVTVTNLAGFPFPVFGADLVASGGSFSLIDGTTSVIEYFFPSGAFGTPPSPPGVPFPLISINFATYDGSDIDPDDAVGGQLAIIPEPGSMFLMASGLLSMLGFGRKFWN